MMVSGGKREGAGRKSRPTSKAKGIWCGQITDEQRDFVIQWLLPDERYGVLMAAANKARTRLPVGGGKLPAKKSNRKGSAPAISG